MHSLATMGLIGHPIAAPSTFEYRTPPFVRWAFACGRVLGVWPFNSGWWAPWWIKPSHQMTPVHPPRPDSSPSTVEWGRHCSLGHTGSYPLMGPRCRPHAGRLHSRATPTMGCSGFPVLWTLDKPWNRGIVIEVGYKCLYWISLRALGSLRSFSCLTSAVVYMDVGSWSRWREGLNFGRIVLSVHHSNRPPLINWQEGFTAVGDLLCWASHFFLEMLVFGCFFFFFFFFWGGGGGMLENLGAIRS